MKRVIAAMAVGLALIAAQSLAGNGNLIVDGQLGVGTATPAASAALEINSATKGLLPPRLTAIQRNAIASPATGLLIFNTTENTYNFYTGATWISLGTQAGFVEAYAGTAVPTGWLECNGAEVSRTTYAALFAAIGTSYGEGDGSTTFKLPDLRGEFIRGWDNSRGIDAGRGIGSWQDDMFKSHTHEQRHGYYQSSDLYDPSSAYGNNGTWTASTESWQYTGGTETRPRNVALMYCIKY